MSIPYHLLHKKALEYLPDSPIKATSTWIAILVHSILEVDDVSERSQFLWIKCHGKITLRTLMHEYFSRHPLEGFQLKFWDCFPKEGTQVKQLRAYQRAKHDHDHQIIVLRAFEEEDAEAEEERDEEERIAEEKQASLADRGPNKEHAIVLEDGSSQSEDEQDENSDGSVSESGSEEAQTSQTSQMPTSALSNNVEVAKRNPKKRSLDEDDESDSDEEAFHKSQGRSRDSLRSGSMVSPSPSHASSAQFNSRRGEASSELLSESNDARGRLGSPIAFHGDPNATGPSIALDEDTNDYDAEMEYSNESFDEEMALTADNTWNDFHDRVARLPSEFRDIDLDQMHVCDFCGKQMFIKPWTYFGPGNTPLCTDSAKMMLERTNDWNRLNDLEAAVQEELDEKERRKNDAINGLRRTQNLDPDAPLDYPQQLLTSRQVLNLKQGKDVDADSDSDDCGEDGNRVNSNNDSDNDDSESDSDDTSDSVHSFKAAAVEELASPPNNEQAVASSHSEEATIRDDDKNGTAVIQGARSSSDSYTSSNSSSSSSSSSEDDNDSSGDVAEASRAASMSFSVAGVLEDAIDGDSPLARASMNSLRRQATSTRLPSEVDSGSEAVDEHMGESDD